MRPNRLPVAFFMAFAILLLAACSSKPESTIEAFYRAAEKGDVEKATAQISFANVEAGQMVQAKGKVQMIVGEMQGRIQANDGLQRIEVLDSKVTGDGSGAQIQVKLIFNNGKDLIESHRLAKEDDGWKIRLL